MAEKDMTIAEWMRLKLSKRAREEEREQRKPPAELKVFNPLELKVNDFVPFEVPHPDLLGKRFMVIEIDLWERDLGGQFVDYILEGDVSVETVTLRAYPKETSDASAPRSSDLLVLFPHRRLGYDEEGVEFPYKEILMKGLPLEVRDDSGNVMATYARLNGAKKPYSGKVTLFKGKNTPSGVEHFDYWDYGRDVEDGGVAVVDYYFVEMSQNDEDRGTIQTYRGVSVSQYDVKPLRRAV